MDNFPSDTGLTISEPEKIKTNPSWFWPFVIGVSAFILIFSGFILWTISRHQPAASYPSLQTMTPSQQKNTTISGIVYVDGYATPGAMLVISARQVGKSGAPKITIRSINTAQGSTAWIWDKASEGINYEIYASLESNGKVIQETTPIVVSSPATNVILRLTSTQQSQFPRIVTLGGLIHLKGYIASSSSVTILAKSISAAVFGPIATASAVDKSAWTWNGAAEGATYDIKAQLQGPDGAIISNEAPTVVTAPSNSEELSLTSLATPPILSKSILSGTIILNGVAPAGSYVTLSTRKSGTTAFTQVLSNISATTNVSWSWSDASVSASYDIQATLWSGSKQIAVSQIITTTAPSTETLTINAQMPILQRSQTVIPISYKNTHAIFSLSLISYDFRKRHILRKRVPFTHLA